MNDQAVMDELFGMMKIAKTQQEAVQTALVGLEAERQALAKTRAALAATVTQQTEAVNGSIPGLQKAVRAAVSDAVSESLVGASETAARAVSVAATPFVRGLSDVVASAGEAERSLKRAGQWFAWKWVAVAGGGLVGVCLVAYAALAWQLYQVSSLREEKAALQDDVMQLQATVATLEKKGGRIKMTTCGKRLCIEASSNQWKGEGLDAPWKDTETGVKLVIPRGY
jgi:hypothetical protein